MGTLDPTLSKKQGHMEALNTVRRHATYIDGKMLSVTKYSLMLQYSACAIEQFLCYITEIITRECKEKDEEFEKVSDFCKKFL